MIHKLLCILGIHSWEYIYDDTPIDPTEDIIVAYKCVGKKCKHCLYYEPAK